MNSMKPVRLAVAGVGLIGRKHMERIHTLGDCTLVGVCDVDPGRKPVADEFDVPFYRDVNELLQRREAGGGGRRDPQRRPRRNCRSLRPAGRACTD